MRWETWPCHEGERRISGLRHRRLRRSWKIARRSWLKRRLGRDTNHLIHLSTGPCALLTRRAWPCENARLPSPVSLPLATNMYVDPDAVAVCSMGIFLHLFPFFFVDAQQPSSHKSLLSGHLSTPLSFGMVSLDNDRLAPTNLQRHALLPRSPLLTEQPGRPRFAVSIMNDSISKVSCSRRLPVRTS